MKKEEEEDIKNYSSVLAIVNHRNWLDDSPPLILFRFHCNIVIVGHL